MKSFMSCITLATPSAIVQEARAYARRTDTTLNAMIRDYLERIVGKQHPKGEEYPVEAFAQLVAEKGAIRSEPYRFHRADAYDGEE